VVVLAQDEARLLKHNYIGTEHLLLGLLREEEGLAARVLESLDVTVEEVRAQVARIVGEGDEVTVGQIPFTPRAKKVLELSLRESQSLGHNYIGTEHILLGLRGEGEGVANHVLERWFGLTPEEVRQRVIEWMSGPGRRERRMADVDPSNPQLTQAVARKEKAIEAQDFELAAGWRDVERRLRRGDDVPWPPAIAGRKPAALPRPTFRRSHPARRGVLAQSALVGAFCLGIGILIGRAIWG
jgi:ATP-dependent Clp protease ATP-binding subunit ClpA